jgi:rhodanese-related sulfurtransferase
MTGVPGVRKRAIIVGLALILIIGIGPRVSSQEMGRNPIQQAAEIVFEAGARFMSADALYENLNDGDPDNDPVIISLRSAEDYAKGHISGAVHMGLATLFTPEGLATLPPDRSVVLVCYTGQSASQATSALNMLGYDAYALQFGMSSWTTDPEVFVKRFNPEVHTRDYAVDLETHEPGGPYGMPAPLVDAAPQPAPEPAPPSPVAELPQAAMASNCVSCHTNRETLEALAVEKEVKSEMTSGEG